MDQTCSIQVYALHGGPPVTALPHHCYCPPLGVVDDEMLECEPFISAGAMSGETCCFLLLVPGAPGFEFPYVLTLVMVENFALVHATLFFPLLFYTVTIFCFWGHAWRSSCLLHV